MTKRLLDLPVTDVFPRADQPRRHFDRAELVALAASLDEDGQAVPAIVRPHPKKPGKFELVGGERRWRAIRDHCRKRKTLSVIVIDQPNDDRAFRLSFLENENRVALSPLESADAVHRLIESGLCQADIARMLGKSDAYVNALRSLDRLHDQVKRLLSPELPDRQRLSKSAAVVIAKLPKSRQLAVAKKATGRSGMRMAQLEHLVHEMLNAGEEKNPKALASLPPVRYRHGHAALIDAIDRLIWTIAQHWDARAVEILFGKSSTLELKEALGRVVRLRDDLNTIAQQLTRLQARAN